VFGRLRGGRSVEPAADALDRTAPDERPELLAGDADIRHLAWAEEGAETARAEDLRRVGSSGSMARFVGMNVYHADILVEPRP
jgi:hypothetical protein